MPKDLSALKAKHPVFFWDFTLSCETCTKDGVVAWCREVGKQWCFQEEEAPGTGYRHYQGRINLRERVRFLPLPEGYRGHQSPTTVDTAKGKKAFSYVMKSETRVNGPWSDRDVVYVPSDVPEHDSLRPWQSRCLAALRSQGDRQIMFLNEPTGNVGKTTLLRYLACRERAIYVPPICENAQQMAGFVYAAVVRDPSARQIIVFDMPRAISEHSWKKAAPVIEQAKDGYAFDGRNTAKQCLFEKPKILVAYNNLPGDLVLGNLFSHDKIQFWNDFD